MPPQEGDCAPMICAAGSCESDHNGIAAIYRFRGVIKLRRSNADDWKANSLEKAWPTPRRSLERAASDAAMGSSIGKDSYTSYGSAHIGRPAQYRRHSSSHADRQCVVEGKRVAVRVVLRGRRIIKK